MVLFEKLRVLRKRTGLSQMELAEKLRVSRQAISNWEAGTTRPSIDNIHYLSKLYNIPLEILLDDDAGVEKVIKPTDFREEPQQVREGKDSKRKKAIGIIVTLIVLVLVASISRFFPTTAQRHLLLWKGSGNLNQTACVSLVVV